MARDEKKPEKYLYPTHYGSHASMIDEEATKQLNQEKLVVCKDENGWYVTDKNRTDGRSADSNRYASKNARDMKFWGIDKNQPKVNPLPIEKPKEEANV